MTIVTTKPSNFFNLVISIISDINPSPICLFLTHAVYCVEIKSGRTFIILSERAFDIIFKFIFNKEMDLQFCMNLFSFFLSI